MKKRYSVRARYFVIDNMNGDVVDSCETRDGAHFHCDSANRREDELNQRIRSEIRKSNQIRKGSLEVSR